MPKLTKSLPRIRKHKASGQAVIYLDGQTIYLGRYGSKVAKEQFDTVVSEWLSQNRSLPAQRKVIEDRATVNDVCLSYLRWAKTFYIKNGRPTTEVSRAKRLIAIMKPMYGKTAAVDFGPIALKAVRQRFVDEGWARSKVNAAVHHVIRIFAHAAENEAIPGSVVVNLRQVKSLAKGKTKAYEPKPVKCVSDRAVDLTLPQMPTVVADMVRLQRLLGCRPAEICQLRPCDLNRSGDVWVYEPNSHKTEHHGKTRTVFVGPRAQEILLPYLLRPSESCCFDPREAVAERFGKQQRKTPLGQGNRPGYSKRTREGKRRKRPPREQYDTASYRRAIHRACEKAGVEKWSPNRLRHTRGTEVREKFGLEAAQVSLGHANAQVTQIYAERDHALAAKVAKETG